MWKQQKHEQPLTIHPPCQNQQTRSVSSLTVQYSADSIYCKSRYKVFWALQYQKVSSSYIFKQCLEKKVCWQQVKCNSVMSVENRIVMVKLNFEDDFGNKLLNKCKVWYNVDRLVVKILSKVTKRSVIIIFKYLLDCMLDDLLKFGR
jgi:hypothetical protein